MQIKEFHKFDIQLLEMQKLFIQTIIVLLFLSCSALNLKAQNRTGYDYYYAGLDQMAKRNFAVAITLLDSAEAGGVDIFDLYNNRGISYYNIGQYKAALENYNSIISKSSLYKSAYINAANAYYKMGNYEMAEKYASELIKEKEFDQFAYNITGNIYLSKKQYQLALDNYLNAIQLDSQLASAYYNCGIAYYWLKQYDSSIYYHEKARALNPNDLENLYGLALSLSKVKRTDESMELCYEIISRDSLHYRSYAEIGNNMMQDPAYDPEIVSPFLQKSINMQPQQMWSSYNNLGNVYLRQGMNDKALENFNKSIEVNADNPHAYSGRGDIYNGEGMYGSALHDYLMAQYLDPAYNYPNLALGDMMMRMNKPDEADVYYNRFMELSTDKNYAAKVMNTTQATNELSTAQYSRALLSAELALAIDPDYAPALNKKGMAMARLTLFDSALFYINKSLKTDASQNEAYYNRAYVYANTGNAVLACADLQHAMELKYNGQIDYTILLLNQKKCKFTISNTADTSAINYEGIIKDIKQHRNLIDEEKKNELVNNNLRNIAGTTNVNIEKLDVIQMISPDPAMEDFTIQLKGRIGKPFTVNVIGLNGQSTRQFNFNELQRTNFSFSCRDWLSGNYEILLIAENKEIGRRRLVVQH